MSSDIRTKIRNFIVDNFLFGEEGDMADDTSFLEKGIVDSTGILELVEFIENEFVLKVRDEELIPENLDSIARVEAFLSRRIAAERSGKGPAPAMGAGAGA